MSETTSFPTALLRTRRFLPLFVTQTCGALNDNLVKNAIAILALMRMAEAGPAFVAILGGVFIAPYVLFSGLAGEIADSRDKARMIRWTKALEALLMIGAAIGFATGSFPVLVAVLFGLGVQSTLFSPLKYGILPQHLRDEELIAGNGLIEAGTFSGILVGTIAGGALIGLASGPLIVAGLGIALAALGFVLALQIPSAPTASPGLRVDWNIWRSTRALVVTARGNRPVWLSILGLSWFWTLGATVLSALPVIAQTSIRGDNSVATLLLTVFAVGVSIGSVLCAKLLKGEVSARYVPFAAIAISIGCADLALTCFAIEGGAPLANWTAVLASPLGWRLLADLLLLAIGGGLYSVPLYAIIQDRSGEGATARMIAANNVVNAVAMVFAAVLTGGLIAAGVAFEVILLVTAALNLVAAFIIAALLPQEVLKTIFRVYFRLLHRVEVVGLENYPAEGVRAIVTPNHLSLADGALVAAFLPGYPTFAVDVGMTRKWWARPFLAPIDVFPVEPANPYSVKSMMRAVRDDNKRLVIFPEGRLTRTGALMKVYDGTGVIADKAGAVVVPVRLEGLQYSHFSYLGGVVRRRWFPRYRITILPPVCLTAEVAFGAGAAQGAGRCDGPGDEHRRRAGRRYLPVTVQRIARRTRHPWRQARHDRGYRTQSHRPVARAAGGHRARPAPGARGGRGRAGRRDAAQRIGGCRDLLRAAGLRPGARDAELHRGCEGHAGCLHGGRSARGSRLPSLCRTGEAWRGGGRHGAACALRLARGYPCRAGDLRQAARHGRCAPRPPPARGAQQS